MVFKNEVEKMLKQMKWITGMLTAVLVMMPQQLVQAQSVIEEITVTARQREESLKDVPGAVTVLTANQIERSGVQRAKDFIALTPGVTIVDTAEVGDTQVSIRGINGARDAETSFGLIIDGIVMTNPAALNREYLDLRQIEIVKGPQGALYGRNASAGAIIITTAKPSDVRSHTVKVSIADDSTYAVTGRADIPLDDTMALSITANFNTSDGWHTNTFLNCDDCVDQYESQDIYARLIWDVDAETSIDAKFRYGQVDTTSIQFNPIFELPGFAAYLGNPDLYEDVNDHPWSWVSNIPHFNDQESLELSVRMERDLGWANLTAWGLYSDIENSFGADGTSGAFQFLFADPSCIASVAEVFNAGFALPSPQGIFAPVPAATFLGAYTPTRCDGTQYQVRNQSDFSFEVRWTSYSDQALRWTAGLYFLDVDREVGVNQGNDLGYGIVEKMYVPASGKNPTEQMVWDDFDTKVTAFFGSISYDLTDDVELSLAGRYDNEHRKVHSLVPTGVNSTYIDCDGPPYTGGPLNVGLCQSSSIPDQSENFKHFQPKVSLSLDVTQSTTIYGSWGVGFKSGGFNNSGSRATVDVFINSLAGNTPVAIEDNYKKETNNSFELGFKSRLLGNRVSVEGAVYHTSAKNLQFFEFIVGPFGLLRVIENIDKSEITGQELGLSAIVNDNISLYASVSKIDSEILVNSARADSVGNAVPYHAEYTYNAGISLDYPMAGGRQFFAQIDFAVVGPTWFHVMQTDNSRNTLFGAPMVFDKTDRNEYTTVNLRVGVKSDNLTVTAFAKNLTDERYLAEVIPAPEFGGVFAHPADQRRMGVEVVYQF